VSNALNAWIMMQAVGWNVNTTQLVYLDDGFPSATDVLQERILSPNFPVIKGKELMGNIVHFENIFLTPFENTGPMMRHLNDDEPCQRNKMLLEFRKKSFEVMNVKDKKTSPESCLVTVITRRPYEGRRVQRIWLNEDEVLDQMRKDYAKCTFQSIDFVDLSLEKQMTLMKDSDMVISMHGAGLVNLFWTREGTHVIEIFPKKRFRWGYRNLCQFIGCEWNEFRGGNDTGVGDNASDKTIPYEEWKPFFDPIFTKMMGQKLQ
jgi:protein O-GlcNAc transferase